MSEFKLMTGTGGQVACGVRQIEAERARQIHELGRTAEHDDQHVRGQLAEAAAYYSQLSVGDWYEGCIEWPWGRKSLDPTAGPRDAEIGGYNPTVGERIEQLAKAGALCAAEIDRLLRLKEAK